MSDLDIFSTRLKSAREMREMTQLELGEKAGLTPTSIAHFEAGSRKPSFDNLRKLAEALEVKTDYLLGRADDPTNDAIDVLYRDAGKLTEHDRRVVESLIKTLIEKDTNK